MSEFKLSCNQFQKPFNLLLRLESNKSTRYRGLTAVVTNNKLLSWKFKCELLFVVYNLCLKALSVLSAKVFEPLWLFGLKIKINSVLLHAEVYLTAMCCSYTLLPYDEIGFKQLNNVDKKLRCGCNILIGIKNVVNHVVLDTFF